MPTDGAASLILAGHSAIVPGRVAGLALWEQLDWKEFELDKRGGETRFVCSLLVPARFR